MTTGQAGINTDLPWQEKSRMRDREHFAAASEIGILSSPLNLWHDYPVPRPLDQRRFREGTQKILEGFLTRWAPEIIFRPMPGDLHPDHVLTYEFALEVAKQAFGEGVWGRGFPNVFSYASPWYSGASGANAYFYFDVWHGSRDLAAEPAARSNAIVGAEICMNVFGVTPPRPNEFGGAYAEKTLNMVIGG
jgi:LmbE family N-acetylglucosaminyl deacetylase